MDENDTNLREVIVLGIDFYGNDTFQLALYFTVFFVGILGNALILAVYLKKKRRTSTDIFIIALSLIDLAASIQISIQIIRIWLPSVITDNFCIINWTLGEATAFASLLLTFAICYDRYMVVCRPFSSRLSNKRAIVYAVSCVILGIILMVPKILIIGATKLGRPVQKTICEARRNVWFLWLVQVLYPLMCFGVMLPTLYLYRKIYVSLRRQAKIHADLLCSKPKSSSKELAGSGQAITKNSNSNPGNDLTALPRCSHQQSNEIIQFPTHVSGQFVPETVCIKTRTTSGTGTVLPRRLVRINKIGPSCKATSSDHMLSAGVQKNKESDLILEDGIRPSKQMSADSITQFYHSKGGRFGATAVHAGKINGGDLEYGNSNGSAGPCMNKDTEKPISNLSSPGQSFGNHGKQTSSSGALALVLAESGDPSPHQGSNRTAKSKNNDMGQATTRMLLIITIYFFITWLPYIFAASLYSRLLELLPRDSVEFIFLILNAIRGTNHTVNIVVYYYANRWFRKAIRNLLCRKGTL